MLGNKTGLNKFKKTEIIQNIFSDENWMKLENNSKRKMEKLWKTEIYVEIKQHTCNNQ